VTRRFLDTNVLVYLYDRADDDKRRKARAIVADESATLVLSSQVLGEFFVVVTRRLSTPLSTPDAITAVRSLADLSVVPIDSELVLAASSTVERHQLSYWDALIVEAAATSGCTQLMTEDLNAGSTLRGVTIVNPFT
jgi:predicted nucleic acid-binding protein